MNAARDGAGPSCSAILPVYNEEACIEEVLRELIAALEAARPGAFEVVAVDDGSADGTGATLARLAGAWPALRVVTLARNSGQSAAFCAGFRAARGAVFVTMDADGQNDPADIPKLLEALDGCDCCCGYRAARKDTWSKRYGSRLANSIRNRVLGEDIIDTGCSLKAFRAGLTRELTPWDGMHRFFAGLFAMQGATIRQVPVNHRPRAGGRSKYTNWGRLKKTWWDLWAVRWLKKRFVRIEIADQQAPDARSRRPEAGASQE